MKVFIIGGTGYIGRHLGARLRELGHEALCTGRIAGQNPHAPHIACNVIHDDILVPPGTDAVIYLAQAEGYNDFPNAADQIFGVNALGPLKAAAAAAKVGCPVFLFASTGSVYAPSFAPLAEGAPLDKSLPYALSKLHAEEALGLFANRLQTCSCRLFGVFGPGQENKLAPRLVSALVSGQPIFLQPHPGEEHLPLSQTHGLRLSWLYVADAVEQLIALARLGASGAALPPALNIAGPEALSLRDFALALGKACGKAPAFQMAAAARPTDRIACIDLAKRLLAPTFTPLAAAASATAGAPQSRNPK